MWALALLVPATSLAAASVSPWLVPPYLLLIGWLLIASAREQGPAAPTSDAEDDPSLADGVEAGPADATTNPEPETATDASAGPASSETDAPARKPKRGRGKARGKAKGDAVVEPAQVAWVRVGPGKFVRVEGAAPPRPDPTPSEAPHDGPSPEGPVGAGIDDGTDRPDDVLKAPGDSPDGAEGHLPAVEAVEASRPEPPGDEPAAIRDADDRGEGDRAADPVADPSAPDDEPAPEDAPGGEIPPAAEEARASEGDPDGDATEDADPAPFAEVEGRGDGSESGRESTSDQGHPEGGAISASGAGGETLPEPVEVGPPEEDAPGDESASGPEPPDFKAERPRHPDAHLDAATGPVEPGDSPDWEGSPGPDPGSSVGDAEPGDGDWVAVPGETGNMPSAPGFAPVFAFVPVSALAAAVGAPEASSPRSSRPPSRWPGPRPGRARRTRSAGPRRSARPAGATRPRTDRGSGYPRRISRTSAPRAPPRRDRLRIGPRAVAGVSAGRPGTGPDRSSRLVGWVKPGLTDD